MKDRIGTFLLFRLPLMHDEKNDHYISG